MSFANRKKGFTLIELLIVVVILGIIAAIVVPQFTIATDDAKLNTLMTNLATVRAQLQLYKLEHNAGWPTDNTTLSAQLCAGTDAAGNAGTTYGPYLMKMPQNPFVNIATPTITAVKTTGAAADISSWYYLKTNSIVFRANDSVSHHDNL